MANLIRLRGSAAELPYLSLSYPVDPGESSLAAGLAAYQDLKLQPALQSLPRERREEVTAFLRRYGAALYRVLFPGGQGQRLDSGQPLLIQCDAMWGMYPWELLHDGREWLALRGGVTRLHPGGDRSAPKLGFSSVLGIASQPLPAGDRDPLSVLYRVAGARFVTALPEVVEPLDGEIPGFTCRVLAHASADEFRRGLMTGPDVLLWSGFADAESLWFQSNRIEGQPLPFAIVQETLREAVRRGLKLVIANESLGLIDPARSATRAEAWLETGLPWLIAIEGEQARVRQHDYLRTLTRHLAQGFTAFESHLGALRRLHRRFEEGWDWSYARFHARQVPRIAERGEAYEVRIVPSSGAPASGQAAYTERRPGLGGEDPARPAPPVFRARRRVFARHEELRALADAVLPERRADTPLVFLSGPPGSGKTVLALETARRLHRRFGTILYLHGRDLLPPLGEPSYGGPSEPGGSGSLGGGERLAAEIGLRLGLRSGGGSGGRSWLPALRAALPDGDPKLIVLDGMETWPGFEPLLSALAEPAPDIRLLALTRGKPPLLPGFRLELAPVNAESLASIFDDSFAARLAEHPARSLLPAVCRRDLLTARLLRRLEAWPDREWLAAQEAPGPAAPIPGRDALLEWAASRASEELGNPARGALEALLLLPGMVHRDWVRDIAGMEARMLSTALAELQWFGLADLYDEERYVAAPPRIQRVLGPRVMTRRVFARLAPRLALRAEAYLAATGAAIAQAPAGSLWEDAPAAFAWRAEPSRRNSAGPRAVQQLAVERSNLAETAMILAEEGDLRALARLAEGAKALGKLPWLSGLESALGAQLSTAAATAHDLGLQAAGLNRIGAALLNEDRTLEASAVLERALELLHSGSNWDALGETYLLLARSYVAKGQLDAAENLLASATELAYQTGSGSLLVQSLEASAAVWRRRASEIERAEQHMPRAIRFLEERQHHHLAAQVRRLHAGCQSRAARYGEAERGYRQALQAFLRAGDRREAARTGLHLADCLAIQERAAAALEAFEEARAGLAGEHAEDPVQLAATLARIGELFQRQGRMDLAVRALLQVRDWHEQAGDRAGVIRVLDLLGGLYFQLGQQSESTRCYEERLILQSERNAATA